jgi:hypothetical protein
VSLHFVSRVPGTFSFGLRFCRRPTKPRESSSLPSHVASHIVQSETGSIEIVGSPFAMGVEVHDGSFKPKRGRIQKAGAILPSMPARHATTTAAWHSDPEELM